MVKKIIIPLLILVITNSFIPSVLAQGENNKFGIHLAQPDNSDLQKAADLVNSNGGKWGYVTLVIQENDRDLNKWQSVFNHLRELQLIPIIRIATKGEGAHWRRPVPSEANEWANFLNSLNWVTKERYVVLFNEPNHAGEWGGNVDAKNFAQVSEAFAEALKKKSTDFYVMLAGLDASAPEQPPFYEDEGSFLKEVVDEITPKKFNELFSGLSSHSYPNPGFMGSPTDVGRGTIKTYEWELNTLKDMGIKDLPVFITETGWDGTRLSRATVADYFDYAFKNIWLSDSRVMAVTPFVLNYQQEPFLNFSWAKMGNGDYYPQYYDIQKIEKPSGDPEIVEKGKIVNDMATELVVNSSFHFRITMRNDGEAIWDQDRGYHLVLEGIDPTMYFFNDLSDFGPGQQQDVDLYMKTDGVTGVKKASIALYKGSKKILDSGTWAFEVVPFPDVTFKASLYPKLGASGDDYEFQVFDKKESLVYKKTHVQVSGSQGTVEKVPNIALGQKYRVVLLKPYYLPRQTFVTFKKGTNQVKFDRMYPVDFNKDGKFDWQDFVVFMQNPGLISLFFP